MREHHLRAGRARRCASLLFVAGLATLTACSHEPEPARETRSQGARRDLVLITIDTLRYDATGFSGAGRVETPLLDRLAAGGRVFTRAHAHAVVTLPSHASILTGLYPYEHGVRDNAGFTLAADVPTLATRLAGEGFATAAFVSAFPLDRRFGLDRGFAVYDDDYQRFEGGLFTFAERPGEETVARAVRWWEAQRSSRRFLWVHLFTPHFPYEPSEPFASRYADAPYYGEAALTDAQLAPLLEPILTDGADSTIVLLTSDHGEALGDHGEATHGLFAYESTLRVPLVLWAPGRVTPGEDARRARHVDLLPTALELLGLAPDGGSGRSLVGTDAGAESDSYFEALTAYFNRGWAPLYGRIEGEFKAIELPIPELYDLAADPTESDNLAPREPGRLASMLAELRDEARGPSERGQVDREVMERLRALGYVASGNAAPQAESFGEDDDPKRRVDDERLLFDALTLYGRGEQQRAMAVLEDLIDRQPRMSVAYGHLAFMYTDQGRIDDAVRLLRRGLGAGLDSETTRRQLALALVRQGDADEAWQTLLPHEASADPETQAALGRIAAAQGRTAEAEARIDRALAIDPTFPQARIDRGILWMMEGRFEAARGELEAGLRDNPRLAEGWNALGVVRSRAGQLDQAVEAWHRALDCDPRLPDALFNLALAQAHRGERAEAAAALERYVALVQGDERRRAEGMLRELRQAGGD